MATQSKNTLKGYFKTGDKPTQSNFTDLIDSFAHKTEDRATATEVQTGTNNTKFVTPIRAKEAAQHWAPVKTVNGIQPTSNGNVTVPLVEDSGWQQVSSFANGTSSLDSPSSVRFRKKNGTVFLDGKIKGGTNQTNGVSYLLFSLPEGFMPSRITSFAVIMANTSTTSVAGRIDIHPDGRVYGVLYSNIWTNLSDIVFNVD